MQNTTLSKELNLLIKLTKPKLNQEDISIIKEELKEKINEIELLGLIQYHKVTGPVWSNIKEHFIKSFDSNVLRSLDLFHKAQKLRAEEQLKELEKMCSFLDVKGIDYVILKGVSLSGLIYQDIGARLSNDIDILVHPNKIEDIINLFNEHGYIQGYYNHKEKSVMPASRRDIITAPLTTHEIIPLIKANDGRMLEHITFDIQFSLELMTGTRTDDKVSDFLGRRVKKRIFKHSFFVPSSEDILLFLTLHFYKESLNEYKNKKKIAYLLYKLTDLKFLLTKKDLNINKFNDITFQYDFRQEVYNTFCVLNDIYPGTLPNSYIDIFKHNDFKKHPLLNGNTASQFFDRLL